MFSNREYTQNEYKNLIDFLADKAKSAKAPLGIGRLCKEFKETYGSKSTETFLQARIIACRTKFHQLEEFDNDTKAKVMFVLSTPVNRNFLIELQRKAYVEVDEGNRIVKYEKKQENDCNNVGTDSNFKLITERDGSTEESAEMDLMLNSKRLKKTGNTLAKHEPYPEKSLARQRSSSANIGVTTSSTNEAKPKENRESAVNSTSPYCRTIKRKLTRATVKSKTVKLELKYNTCLDGNDAEVAPVEVKEEKTSQEIDTPSLTASVLSLSTSDEQSASEQKMISSKKILEWISCLTLSLNLRELRDIYRKAEKAILEMEDSNIPADDFIKVMESSLLIIINNGRVTPQANDSTSLKDFLLILRTTLYSLRMTDINEFQAKLTDSINKLGKDKPVLIRKIRHALIHIQELITP